MDTFSRFQTRAQMNELDDLFKPHTQLDHFERAQMLTLCPGEVEEAKLLIPSIANKISDEDLAELLMDVNGVRRRH
jgi:DNA-directed RNA polymerase II subunit RPB4